MMILPRRVIAKEVSPVPIADDIAQYYPDDWDEIREAVLERATADLDIDGVEWPAPCCEWCGVPNGARVLRWRGLWSVAADPKARWLDDSHDEIDRGWGPEWEDYEVCSRVVLTIAHLDQDPRGRDLDRLRPLCQRCHLTYDARPEQRARRERIYAELRGQQTIPGVEGAE